MMGRHNRTEFYRSNRDYGGLLEDGDFQEDKYEEALEETEGGHEYRHRDRGMTPPEEEPLSQACREYFERRQKLKEVERQKLRKSPAQNQPSSNGPERKKLPYDNYGSFFGPSEPIVARRVIENARAREEAAAAAAAAVIAAKTANEASERHAKGASGPTRSSTLESRAMENLKQAKPTTETASRAQRLKEARDYTFLFTDEDPTAAPPPIEPSTKRHCKERVKQPTSASMGGQIQQKGPAPMKSGSGSTLATSKLPASYGKVTMVKEKSPIGKQSSIGDRNLKPAVVASNCKVLSGRATQSNKLASVPARPSQDSLSSVVNGRKATTAVQSHARKVEPTKSGSIPATKGGKWLPYTVGSSGKMLPAADSIVKRTPVVSMEWNKASGSSARPRVVAERQPAGHLDQRHPVLVVVSSKQVTKPVTKSRDVHRPHKRPRDSESDDSFLDDDDDGAGDISSIIRKMFGYNPKKYCDIDNEDDRMMEADFRTIEQEEKRSARIAREEDERELALIEEEERQERARAKARKLKQRSSL